MDSAVGYDVQVCVLKLEIAAGLWSDVGAGAVFAVEVKLGNNGYEFVTAIRWRCWWTEFQELSCKDRCMLGVNIAAGIDV